jgi:hypothetical protein
VSDQREKSDPAERADECEERRLPFSLDSFGVDLGCNDRRGILEARGEEGGMMAVTGYRPENAMRGWEIIDMIFSARSQQFFPHFSVLVTPLKVEATQR